MGRFTLKNNGEIDFEDLNRKDIDTLIEIRKKILNVQVDHKKIQIKNNDILTPQTKKLPKPKVSDDSYSLKIGDSIHIGEKNVVLDLVTPGGSVMLDVDGFESVVNGKGILNGVKVDVDNFFYSGNKQEDGATLRMSEINKENISKKDIPSNSDIRNYIISKTGYEHSFKDIQEFFWGFNLRPSGNKPLRRVYDVFLYRVSQVRKGIQAKERWGKWKNEKNGWFSPIIWKFEKN